MHSNNVIRKYNTRKICYAIAITKWSWHSLNFTPYQRTSKLSTFMNTKQHTDKHLTMPTWDLQTESIRVFNSFDSKQIREMVSFRSGEAIGLTLVLLEELAMPLSTMFDSNLAICLKKDYPQPSQQQCWQSRQPELQNNNQWGTNI